MIQIVLDSEMSFFKLSWMILKDFGSLNDLAFKCFSLRSISTNEFDFKGFRLFRFESFLILRDSWSFFDSKNYLDFWFFKQFFKDLVF